MIEGRKKREIFTIRYFEEKEGKEITDDNCEERGGKAHLDFFTIRGDLLASIDW